MQCLVVDNCWISANTCFDRLFKYYQLLNIVCTIQTQMLFLSLCIASKLGGVAWCLHSTLNTGGGHKEGTSNQARQEANLNISPRYKPLKVMQNSVKKVCRDQACLLYYDAVEIQGEAIMMVGQYLRKRNTRLYLSALFNLIKLERKS